MEVKNLTTGKTVVTISEEEKEQLLRAINRLSQTFQTNVLPVMQKLGEALKNAAPAIREFNAAAEACQRLDPAFSGPVPESAGFTCKCPDVACDCDPEEGGVRRSPFAPQPTGRTPEQIHHDLAVQHGWDLP